MRSFRPTAIATGGVGAAIIITNWFAPSNNWDELKLDRSFVGDLVGTPAAAAVVAAIIQLAHTLGFRVGAELEWQVEMLEQMDCDQIQGYYFGKPQSAGAANTIGALNNSASAAPSSPASRRQVASA